MTGRERLNRLIRRQTRKGGEGLAWTALVDDATLSGLPRRLQGNWGIDFYDHLDCDVFLLNGWNTPHRLRSPEHRWGADVEVHGAPAEDRAVAEWRTPKGTLTAAFRRGHPVKHPVESLEDLRVYHSMWEAASYVEHDDTESLACLDALVGDRGIVTRFWGPSTIPRLLEQDMGIENFYYLMADHPAEMDALIRTMHECELAAFRLLADGPWESVTLVENTSTAYISPEIYAKYNMPHQRDFVDRVKARGKPAILHMCGHVSGLLDLIKETGCDGIHALTPPPTGDTPWEAALDVLGEDLVVFGCLDPSVFVAEAPDRIHDALDALVTPRLMEANFVLTVMADGIAVEQDRFELVASWARSRGGRSNRSTA